MHLHLEVSPTKSIAIGSDIGTTRALVQCTASCSLVPKFATKPLGAPAGGGRTRSVHTCRVRIHQFKQRRRRIAAVRRAGVCAASYCRTAGIPSLTYGIDVCGVADTPLQSLCATVAGSASPDTYGRSPDLVFHALDAVGVSADPAAEVNALPIVPWAAAWWEHWVPADALRQAFDGASARLAEIGARRWNAVAGPAAATVATL